MHGTRSPAQRPSARLLASTGLTPAACTATRTWPGPATGSAAWPGRSCAGPPNSLTSTALIAGFPPAAGQQTAGTSRPGLAWARVSSACELLDEQAHREVDPERADLTIAQ